MTANIEEPQQRDGARRMRSPATVGAFALFVVVFGLVLFALPGPAPRKHAERIPVHFWHMWTAEWKDVVDRIVDRFNESQDVYEVLPLSVPMTAADSKFLLSVAGGSPPDVMAQWNPVIPKWAESGMIIPLDELMTPQELEHFRQTAYPAVKRIGMYRDKLYGVTTGLNIFALYCRLDHLREAGLSPQNFPTTLEGLVEWGEKLHKRTTSGDFARIGFLPSQYSGFAMFAPGFGGGFYDWNNGAVTINTPENFNALSFLVSERKRLGFERVVRFQSGLAVGIGNADWPFISGSFSITIDGQWRVEQIARYAPDIEYATFPIPPPKGGKPHFGYTNGNFMIIPKGAKEVQGAWEFIKFWSGLAHPERAAEFYTWGGWLPLSPEIANAPIYREYVNKHPQFQTFLDVLPSENVQPTPPVPYQVYLWDRITQADEAAMRGTLTAQQALNRLNWEVQREVESRRKFGYVN